VKSAASADDVLTQIFCSAATQIHKLRSTLLNNIARSGLLVGGLYPTKDPFRSTEFDVFTTKDGRLTTVPMTSPPIGQVQDVSVRDGRIFVETKTFRENDRPCCPTESHSFVLTPSDGVLNDTTN
jgi:hypothetical protein